MFEGASQSAIYTRKSALALLFAAALFCNSGAMAGQNSLFIEQIGEAQSALVNQSGSSQTATVRQTSGRTGTTRAMVYQGTVPDASRVSDFLAVEAADPQFTFGVSAVLDGLETTTIDGQTVIDPAETNIGEGYDADVESVTSLLGSLSGGAGSNNETEVVQRGSNSKVLAVQLGSGNYMRTEQRGGDNLGVHLQEGGNNDTVLEQFGGGNTNALVARGDVSGVSGPLTLHATGDVQGFSVEANGPQPYSTITVSPNGPMGYNITVSR